jgi:hypothetical protein
MTSKSRTKPSGPPWVPAHGGFIYGPTHEARVHLHRRLQSFDRQSPSAHVFMNALGAWWRHPLVSSG